MENVDIRELQYDKLIDGLQDRIHRIHILQHTQHKLPIQQRIGSTIDLLLNVNQILLNI